MGKEEIVLLKEQPEDENKNWEPQISLLHSKKELFVVIGEDDGVMIEGVTSEMFERLSSEVFTRDQVINLMLEARRDLNLVCPKFDNTQHEMDEFISLICEINSK